MQQQEKNDERRHLARPARTRGGIGVLPGLGDKDFDRIPYSPDVVLRAPPAPGGVDAPLRGREQLREVWWAPLPGLLGRVEVGDVYINDSGNGVVTEAEVEVLTDPPVRLKVADRFRVDDSGRIIEQTNYFDPRDLTNPGWRTAS